METIGFILAIIVGISLGLIGGGGSILTVPILVYIIGINPILATSYSLFIVGFTSLTGVIIRAFEKKVDVKTAIIFGIPSIIVVYATRFWLVPKIPEIICSINSFQFTKDIALMLLFAIVMIMASISMIKSGSTKEIISDSGNLKKHYPMILLEGIFVGLLTGLVGAGGGFLIIPALVVLVKMPMKKAIGTSLLIITMNSLIGFLAVISTAQTIDWNLLCSFSFFAILGLFIGTRMSKKIPGENLKKGFGWFVLLMGIYIILKELFLK